MKVPTYTAQSDVTNRTGQTPLRVQANVGAATAAISAQGDLFQQAQRTSMTFLEQETKLQRATELAALENNFAARLQEHNLAAMDNQNPTSMMTNWNESVKNTLNELGRDISDPVVRRRFIASASNDILAGRLNIMKQARANRIDQSKATYLQKIDRLKKQVFQGNSLERMRAVRELYGHAGDLDTNPDFGSGPITGVFQEMENLGLITAAGRVGLESDTRVEIEGGEIYQDLSAAAVSGNADDADAIVNNLANPDRYPNIVGSARNTLLNKAITLRDSLTDDTIARKNKELELASKQRVETQKATNADFLLRLSMELDNEGSYEGERVTVADIDEAFADRKLNATDYKALKKLRLEGGPTMSDANVMFDVRQQISQATSKSDLNDIRNDLPNYLENKILTPGDANTLLNEIQQQEARTPRAIRVKEERKNLMRLLGVNIDGSGYFDAQIGIGTKMPINDAQRTYDDMVANHDVNPTEAYTYLANNFTKQKDFSSDFENANFLAPTSFILEMVQALPAGPMSDENYRKILTKINNSQLAPRMQHEEKVTLELIRKLKEQPINQNNTNRFGTN